MKSYIKIYGPPLCKTIHALEKIAIQSPEVLIKSYYDTITPYHGPGRFGAESDVRRYFDQIGIDIPTERMKKIISDSGHTLGEYDFFFEWARDPTWKEVEDLLCKIDEVLAPLGCRYTIVTK